LLPTDNDELNPKPFSEPLTSWQRLAPFHPAEIAVDQQARPGVADLIQVFEVRIATALESLPPETPTATGPPARMARVASSVLAIPGSSRTSVPPSTFVFCSASNMAS
jgi:hypothetical protein